MRVSLKLHREKIHKAFPNGLGKETDLSNDNRKHEVHESHGIAKIRNSITNQRIGKRVSPILENKGQSGQLQTNSDYWERGFWRGEAL